MGAELSGLIGIALWAMVLIAQIRRRNAQNPLKSELSKRGYARHHRHPQN